MRLGFVFLNNVNSVNSFKEVSTLTVVRGAPSTVYVRVVDLDEMVDGKPLRYIPASGATMVADFPHIDTSKCPTQKVATNPFVEDTSIWSISILAADVLTNNSIILQLTIGTDVYELIPWSFLSVQVPSSNRSYA